MGMTCQYILHINVKSLYGKRIKILLLVTAQVIKAPEPYCDQIVSKVTVHTLPNFGIRP